MNKDKAPKPLPITLMIGLVLFLLLWGLLFGAPAERPAEISYSEFKTLVERGAVVSASLRGSRITAELAKPIPAGPSRTMTTEIAARVPAFGDPALLPALEAAQVPYRVLDPETETGAGRILLGLLPWIVMGIVFYILFSRGMLGDPLRGLGRKGGVGTFLEGTARSEEKDGGPPVTFADVAGQDNAKREVAELVELLRHPERYTRLGAEVPHGVLLMGPPGTGKTLLARALAGEAGVPFFSISASEFIEMFVGVGASRVRHMFEEAKARAPSIIFIDELDAVGRVRGTGLGGGNDEREQTLNQILAEMDGFAGHETVIVLAATNRPDVLDPALLRPGRFDRHVTLDLPDRPARLQILNVHVRKVPLAGAVDLARVAAQTPGFSGADLKNLVNEAAMAAAREGSDTVAQRHFDEMRDKILMGSMRSLAIQPEERHRLAIHEAGHTIAAHYLPKADPLYKVSIIPRGRTLGGTQQLPEEERHTLPEDYLKDRLAVILGGLAAEKIRLGSTSSGADDDIRQATMLARAMVARWGMSEDVGPVDVRDSEEHPFLGREIAQARHFSEATAEAVDKAVRALLTEAETRATDVIAGHRKPFDKLVAALEKEETLLRDAIEACLGPARGAGSRAAKQAAAGQARHPGPTTLSDSERPR